MIDSSTRIGGRYRIDARLGGGGMADVYDAFDEQLDRPVAVKLLRGIDEAGAARRFAEEIRLTARVNHPNIVQLFDAGEHDGSPFLVLERVTGGTLAGEMDGGGMEPHRVAALGEQLASALSHSHAVGIVHRDVKPTNVLLTDDGSARLADFGIATTATATRLTVTGTIAGSAGYVSPEQVLGSGAGAASDIYALGLVLLECLTGAPPWSGTTVEVALARISSDPYIPADLPAGWAPLLAGMTARNPEDRPHIDLVGHALSRLAHDEAYDTTLVAPPAPPADRRVPAVAGMSMLVLLLSALMVLTTDVTRDVAIAGAAPAVNMPAANALLQPAASLTQAEPVPDWVSVGPRVAEARIERKAAPKRAPKRSRAVTPQAAAPARTTVAAQPAPQAPATTPTTIRSAPARQTAAPQNTTPKRTTPKRTTPKRTTLVTDAVRKTTSVATRDLTAQTGATAPRASAPEATSTPKVTTAPVKELTKAEKRAKARAAKKRRALRLRELHAETLRAQSLGRLERQVIRKR